MFESNIDNPLPSLRIPDEVLTRKPEKLIDSVDTDSILRKHIPKQNELSQFIKYLNKKVIHDYELPISLKELMAEYSSDPFYKDIYNYIKKGSCSLTGKALIQHQKVCENYVICNELLFKIRPKTKIRDPILVLCIPSTHIPVILHQYHSTLLAGHQGVTKMYLTLREEFDFPNMFQCIRRFILCCMDCQSRKDKEKDVRIYHERIPLDFRPMSRLSIDIKHMPETKTGYKYILLCTCEISDYVIGIPIPDQKAETIADAIMYKIVCVFGPPKCLIMDEAQSLSAKILDILYKTLNIRQVTIMPYNHGSLKVERYIQTINNMICKQLTETGDKWPLFVQPCCYAMNTFVSALTTFSPYEMVFLHKPAPLHEYCVYPDTEGLTLTRSEYMDNLNSKFIIMKQIVKERREKDQKMQKLKEERNFPNHKPFRVHDIVYMNYPRASELHSTSRKLKQEWIGPLLINSILDNSHYMISDMNGQIIDRPIHIKRLKSMNINLGHIKEGKLEITSNARELVEHLRKAQKLQTNKQTVKAENVDKTES
jgi:hypothetical protein